MLTNTALLGLMYLQLNKITFLFVRARFITIHLALNCDYSVAG